MKLSIWILYDELSAYNPKIEVHDGTRAIEDVRLFSSKGVFSDDYVYVGFSHQFFDGGNHDVLLCHGRNKITMENADITEVLNRVIWIFWKYRSWSGKMYAALSETNSFQAVLDAAHELFRCPMFLGHKNFQIYAITRQYSSEEVYPEWDEVKKLLTMPLDLMRRIKTKDGNFDNNGVKPIIIISCPEDNFPFPHQIRINCFMKGQHWGELYLYYTKSEISEGILQLARYVGDVFGELLDKSENRIVEEYTKYSSLVDLLDGKKVPESIIATFQYVQWREASRLVLYKLSTNTAEFEVMPYNWLCDNINGHAKNDIVFPYRDSIIVISCMNQDHPSTLLNYIKQVIAPGDYHCGVSFPFEKLYEIPTYFLQAGYAIRFSKAPWHEKLHYFKDCMFEGVTHVFKEMCQWQAWALPSLLNLVCEDKRSGSDNFRTLYVFLQHNGHLANTAKELFIHRNTLIYRLKKIQQFLDVDLYSEDTSAYLHFFCSLLSADAGNLLLPQNPKPDENPGADSAEES
jgi:hypothetical protein